LPFPEIAAPAEDNIPPPTFSPKLIRAEGFCFRLLRIFFSFPPVVPPPVAGRLIFGCRFVPLNPSS
jgi:hypothetical protein